MHEVGGWRECGREDKVHNETQMCKNGEREIKAMRMKQVSSYCIENLLQEALHYDSHCRLQNSLVGRDCGRAGQLLVCLYSCL